MMIRNRDFQVTTQTVNLKKGPEVQYVFTGKRGAVYGTMRNQKNPELMFLIDGRGFGLAKGMDGVWLSDKGGELVIVRS